MRRALKKQLREQQLSWRGTSHRLPKNRLSTLEQTLIESMRHMGCRETSLPQRFVIEACTLTKKDLTPRWRNSERGRGLLGRVGRRKRRIRLMRSWRRRLKQSRIFILGRRRRIA